MNRKQLTSAFKHYASLTVGILFDVLATSFNWLSNRCSDTCCYFLSVSANHSRK